MQASKDLDDHGRHPTMWTISAVTWVLDNPDYTYERILGRKIEDPAKEETMTKYLESVEVADLERAVAAGHQLLDKHALETGEFGLEIYLTPPQLPHADQERLGIKDYKLSAEARKQARAIGIRGRTSRRGSHAWSGMPFPSSIAPPTGGSEASSFARRRT